MSRSPAADRFLDRVLPNASDEEREAAREDLKGFIEALLVVAKRLAREQSTGVDSLNPDGRRKIPPIH
ncbi:hypothetical protein [Phenylobacterium sp.]|uniref:hypothetical protein n=1 Tax=Phenylobacterium sp. TaxID=1871053 RepID=UPI00121C9347|nr:hypothetical protein [Phenylobacterium sp.]THD60766.1 MAG: hypothetical protein E8A49_13040 [Phenylobacterium sp.]